MPTPSNLIPVTITAITTPSPAVITVTPTIIDVSGYEGIQFVFAEGSTGGLDFVSFISSDSSQFSPPKITLSSHTTAAAMTVTDYDSDTNVLINYVVKFKDADGNYYNTPDPQIINNPT